ncbi:right-handed parallel beta-helix repeat-containing protein [bacterium]|nr:right-handed parallel beta-helix repeat-containing protein [bacterium]
MVSKIVSVFIVLTVPVFVQAAIIFVPDDHSTIQAAITAAAPGDTIMVRPGTYYENINFEGKALTVESEQGASATIIDGSMAPDPNFGSVVSFTNAEGSDSIIQGFTITNGTGTWNEYWLAFCGGGIFCTNGSSPIIRNNIITMNKHSTESILGGGIFCNDLANPHIIKNEISSNSDPGGGSGGGIFCENSAPLIRSNYIHDNSTIEGGGITCTDGATALILHNIITNHSTYVSGGIHCNSAAPTIIGNTIAYNQTLSWGEGGGINVRDGSQPTIMDNRFTHNTAGKGAGVYIRDSSFDVINNFFYLNTAIAELDGGGGIFIRSSSPLIKNCTFVENSSIPSNRAGGITVWGSTSSPTVVNSILWNNTPTQFYASSTKDVTYSALEGGYPGLGNIDLDPLFVTGPAGDYYLSHMDTGQTTTSPCVDAGNDLAVNACYTVNDGVVCLSDLSTRTDSEPDDSVADIGFHYPLMGPLFITLSHSVGTVITYDRPKSYVYDIIRGNVADIVEENSYIDLGSVACGADDDATGIVEDLLLPENPAPGECFFYLARQDIWSGSYGLSSTGKERRAAESDCP